MKLFVSYPCEERDLAERLRLALEGEGHDVFTDRAELRAGEAYHAALREAIDAADAAVFLLTPRAVARGSYTLTELDLAQRRWRRPGGHVLPVLVQPTPVADIPPYLKAVTLLQPRGDTVAETVAAVARLRPRRARWPVVAGVVVALALLVGGGVAWERQQRAAAAAAEAARQLAAQVDAAARLCLSGSYAQAWDALQSLAVQAGDGDRRTREVVEDCGMRWLRNAKVTRPAQSFADIVDRIQPVLVRGVPRAGTARRRADLLAHGGYADFLRSRDNVAAPDPLPQYEAALVEEADNVYALAMRAHLQAWRGGGANETVRKGFERALATGRTRDWVRSMQWAVAGLASATEGYGLLVADDMRQRGESLDESRANWLWSRTVWVLPLPGSQATALAALPPERWLATFEWAFPRPAPGSERAPLWRFVHALLRSEGPDKAAAMDELRALQSELAAGGRHVNILRAVEARLKRG